METIVYVVERRIGKDGEWQLLAEVNSLSEYTVEEDVKDCQNYTFHIAAVSQYGTRGFSQDIGPLPKPDLTFEQTAIHYEKSAKEFRSVIECNPPPGYNNTDIGCEWRSHFSVRCPDVQSVQPIIDEYKTSAGKKFLLRIHAGGFGCNFAGQVRTNSSCGDYSAWQNVEIDLSDCKSLTDFSCPEEVSPPGIVHGVEVEDMKNGSMHARWREPNDTGSHGVLGYCVQWGHCIPIPMLGNVKELHPTNTTRTVSPEILIPIDHASEDYGLRILALGIGQKCTRNERELAMLRVFCSHGRNGHHKPTVSDRPEPERPDHGRPDHGGRNKGVVIKEENGVKIIHYPHTPRLQVSWEPPKFRDRQPAIKEYAVRWGPLILNLGKRKKFIRVENTYFGNGTEVNITLEEPVAGVYGLQLNPLHSVVDPDAMEWEDSDIMEIYLSDDTETNETTVGSAPYPDGSSTGMTTSDSITGDWSHADMSGPHGSTTAPFQILPRTIPDTSSDQYMAVYIVIPLVCLLSVIMVVIFMLHKRRKRLLLETSRSNNNDNSRDRYNSIRLPNGLRRRGHSQTEFSLPVVPDKWEIPHACLHTGPILGSGAFGHVVKGSLDKSALLQHQLQHPGLVQADQSSEQVTVAIKKLQEDSEDVYRQDFVKEINLMKNIGFHPNVVGMLGCCTLTEPLCLVVEHLPNGDLLNHLRDVRLKLQEAERHDVDYENMRPIHLTTLDLLSYARQIAVGMEFLAQKGYVHRDLAARNVLVGERKTLKIGDFGLARYVYDDKVYVNRKGGKLPIKWMSIEAIFDLTFSTASDVWSFGVVLFEIYTLGGTPYPTLDNKELLRELRKGWRMEKPESCSQELYEIMLSCWRDRPGSRPSFTELRHSLETMIEQNSSVDYMDLCLSLNQEHHIQDSSDGPTREHTQAGLDSEVEASQEQHKEAGVDSRHLNLAITTCLRSEGGVHYPPEQEAEDRVNFAPVEIVCTAELEVDEACCDDVFDSTAKPDLCGCTHDKKATAFNFEEFCNKCGKIRAQFQEKMAKLLPAALCHPSHHIDITDKSSPGSVDFMLQSGCCRGDRIQSDISSSTCSSGECLITPVDHHQKSPTPSGESELSGSSMTFLLQSHEQGPNCINEVILTETRL